MSNKNIMTKLLLRRDTSTNLNPIVPALGEPVFSTDTNLLKIGDGSTMWENLTPINTDTGGCIVDFEQYNALGATGTQPPESGWVQDQYLVGTKQTPWVWTKISYICDNGETIDMYSRVFDSSWIEYQFIGTEDTIETQFPCDVSGNVLTIGSTTDVKGSVVTTGSYTPSGTIEVK